MWQKANSPALITYCAIPTFRTGVSASQQCSTISFLYTNLAIIGALKGRAGGLFPMLVLTFCESLVELIEMPV